MNQNKCLDFIFPHMILLVVQCILIKRDKL